MNTTRTLTALLLACVFTCVAAQERLPDGAIEAAIKRGLSKKQAESVVASGFSSRFTVVIDGPLIRVQREAANAAKEYRTFGLADVTEAMVAPVANFTALPDKPVYSQLGGWAVTPAATHIVVQSKKAGKPAIQPASIETFPQQWTNALGGTFNGQGIIGTFNLADLPVEDFDVVVVTDSRETRVTVKGKDRQRIR